ncbi:MAG: HigA family addiction module antitoxin [Alphaproteobacteria bacterium]
MTTRQYNPPHPGEVLWGLDMEPAGLTINAVAGRLGVDRKTISRIINGRARITAEMSILLGKAFNTTPDLWLNMQRNYDLWHAGLRLKKRADKIKPFEHRLPL